ncbi:tetratricopeptide repeat protein [Amycolatopsis sp. NPDC051128]|uniref:tetratricopeptide repeat protein n=1 Tax=Amycolatopsis sp. NPDC051128 TaxID=3155412 RepID=UPI0034145C2E
MSFDELLHRVQQRVASYRRNGQVAAVVGESARADAVRLWEAVQSPNPEQPAAQHNRQLTTACHALCWLHLQRYAALRGRDLWELARAIEIAVPLLDGEAVLPEPMQELLGPGADPEMQIRPALAFLAEPQTGTDPCLVDAAVTLLTAASDHAHPHQVWAQANLGIAHRFRYQHTRAVADLDQAIAVGRRAAEVTPDGHPRLASLLVDLGAAHGLRFEHTGTPADLDHAIELREQAMDGGYPYRDRVLPDLAAAYLERYMRIGAQADQDRAIELSEEVLLIPSFDADYLPALVTHLANSYLGRYQTLGVPADLDRAIELGRRALALTQAGHPKGPESLANLANIHLARFERLGKVADLQQAIELGEEAVAAASADHAKRAKILSHHSISYQTRFERLGKVADLQQAIELGEEAVAAASADHPERAKILANHSASYRRRFERFGVPTDLDKAIELGGKAVSADQGNTIAPADRAGVALHLNTLASAYARRYERVGVLADLDRAIELAEQALPAFAAGDTARASALNDLGGFYTARFRRSVALADLDRAVKLGEEAVATTPNGDPARVGCLANLSVAYEVRFRHAEVPADLDRAVKLGEEAVAATPNGDPVRVGCMFNLSSAYQARFEQAEVPADLDRAIELGEEIMAVTAADDAQRSRTVAVLAAGYRQRFELSGLDAPLGMLREALAAVLSSETTAPADRVWAASEVGRLAHAMNDHAAAAKLFDTAVATMQLIAPREGEQTDQEHRLGQHQGLVGDAVAAHCALDDTTGAVEAAELGRGVLLAAQLNSRSDLTDLDKAHPELAAQLRRAREQLSTLDPDTDSLVGKVGRTESRRQLWAEHDGADRPGASETRLFPVPSPAPLR